MQHFNPHVFAFLPILWAAACSSAGTPCTTSAECRGSESCLWAKDLPCSAKGACAAPANDPPNVHDDSATCACDGTQVYGLNGKFSKPVTGSLACIDVDAGRADASSDAKSDNE